MNSLAAQVCVSAHFVLGKPFFHDFADSILIETDKERKIGRERERDKETEKATTKER